MHHRTVPYGNLFRREPDASDSFIDLNRLVTILMRRARLIALSVVVALALVGWPGMVRRVRSQVRRLRQ